MEKRDYNEPTLENIMLMVKNIENKICPWIECACGKKMKDTGFTMCFSCKKAGGGQKQTTDVPVGDDKIDEMLDF